MENEELKNENNLLPQTESGEQNPATEAQEDADGNKYVVPGSIINRFGIWLKKKVKWIEQKFRHKDTEYEDKLKIIKQTIEKINKIDEEQKKAYNEIEANKKKIQRINRHLEILGSKFFSLSSDSIFVKIFSPKKLQNKKEELQKKIEGYQNKIPELKNGIQERKETRDQFVMVLAENVERLSKEYEKETSWKTSLKRWAKDTLISLLLGVLLASALIYGIVFYPFKKMFIGKDIVSSNTDVVAVIAYDEDYKDILLESHKFAAAKKLPIMLAGNKTVADEMEKMLALWKYPAEKVFRTAAPATDLNANAEQASMALQKKGYKTPVVFTSPVKIPRTRCEFNRYGMKTAAFINILEPLDYGMDLESGKKFVHDATSRSPYSIGTIFNGLWYYISGPHCWLPGGSGKK